MRRGCLVPLMFVVWRVLFVVAFCRCVRMLLLCVFYSLLRTGFLLLVIVGLSCAWLLVVVVVVLNVLLFVFCCCCLFVVVALCMFVVAVL